MDGVPPQRDPLALDKEAMRQLGYRTVDLLVEWLERESLAIRRASPAVHRVFDLAGVARLLDG